MSTDQEEQLALGRELRDEALERVERNADPDWKRGARKLLWDTIQRGGELTNDDVAPLYPRPHEPRVWGALFTAAERAGLIVNTGRTKPSTQPQCHGRPMTIWQVDEDAVQRAIAAHEAKLPLEGDNGAEPPS